MEREREQLTHVYIIKYYTATTQAGRHTPACISKQERG